MRQKVFVADLDPGRLARPQNARGPARPARARPKPGAGTAGRPPRRL